MISVVLAAVHEGRALQAARLTALSIDPLLPEIRPWLAAEPERYDYCPEDPDSGALASSRSRGLPPFTV